MRKVIFVGGIHGVGKTTFCREVSTKYNLTHFSASELITRIKKKQFTKDKRVDKINSNQDLLIEALKEYTPENQWILLDGHFCLLDKNGEITRIPNQTFSGLFLKAVIVLTGDIEKICIRLRERDNTHFKYEFLESFQREELKYSMHISRKLETPYLLFKNNNDLEEVHDFINKIIKP